MIQRTKKDMLNNSRRSSQQLLEKNRSISNTSTISSISSIPSTSFCYNNFINEEKNNIVEHSESPNESNLGNGIQSTWIQSNHPKFKLITEGDVSIIKLKHGHGNLKSKLSSLKLLCRWETHHLYLNDLCLSSKTPIGFLTSPISYWEMEDVFLRSKGRIIRILISDGSLLIQTTNSYTRDQWFHSIIWKKNIFKYQNLLRSCRRPEVLIKELKSLVAFANTTPVQDPSPSNSSIPLEIVANLVETTSDLLAPQEEVVIVLSPLLEKSHLPAGLCRFFSRHCLSSPRASLVSSIYNPVVRRALKHNIDFGKCSQLRIFLQDYFLALSSTNDGIKQIKSFVYSLHGTGSSCPHPRILSNLVSICLGAIFTLFQLDKKNEDVERRCKGISWQQELETYLGLLDAISEFDDWRPGLAQFLQPLPFPEESLKDSTLIRDLGEVVRRIGLDSRCEVHQMVLGVRDGKDGWFDLYSPTSNKTKQNMLVLWSSLLDKLLRCCGRRKRFLCHLSENLLGSCLLLALREEKSALDALCLFLEWDLVPSEDQKLQIATTLQTTSSGTRAYLALLERQLHLKELQKKGGPRKLSLPIHSTDDDFEKLLNCGALGNLECLSLAFTQITNVCAEQLIKLPSLKYLNLWSTDFGDAGLQLISEHLINLQVLNLCETRVSDKGILSLIGLQNLRKLNLNSTTLSPETYEKLRKEIPKLKDVDIRYTDAYPPNVW